MQVAFFVALALFSSPSLSADSFECNCNYSMVWIDLIFLMDASEAATQEGLAEMWASARTILSFFNVQKSGYIQTEYFAQVGVISYASRPTVAISLGALSGDEIQAISSLPFFPGDKGTNIDLYFPSIGPNCHKFRAVKAAVAEFNSPVHRASSKKVIMLMATSFNIRQGSQDVINFEESDGIFIVYDDVMKAGEVASSLKNLASPGYYFNNLNNTLKDLQNALCDANCFCRDLDVAYLTSIRAVPIGGCFKVSNTAANHNFSVNVCHDVGGVIAFDETAQKTDFLMQQLLHPAEFYIGLEYNFGNKRYEWQDGSPLDQSYQPWSIGHIPTPDPSAGCVAVTTAKLWVTTSCKNGYVYACQRRPCDSTNFC